MRHLVRPQANSCRETLGALNFRPTKSSTLAVACPASAEVLGRISGGRGYGFRALKPPETAENEADAPFTRPAPSPDYLDIDRTHTDLARVLRNLYRRSTQAYLDQGLSVLYLAFGTLDWMDVDNTRFRSPLLLVPVRLTAEGPKAPPRLEPTDDDTVVNPVLALKLDQCGITLPSADALEDGTLSSFLDAARSAVAEHKGWSVGDDLVLSYFSFNKEAMYRDLKENEDRIAKHDAVAAVALGGGRSAISGRFAFEEIRDGEIDEKAAPETTPVILDADSSQRACIAAALDGRSFVMDGPPGTGKSQTIANIIGALLHKGKTVLFVSEKAAALDVVRNRLADVGLHSYLLELHSSKATRKQVAEELGTALTNELVPPDALAGLTVQQALQGRQQSLHRAPAAGQQLDGARSVEQPPHSRALVCSQSQAKNAQPPNLWEEVEEQAAKKPFTQWAAVQALDLAPRRLDEGIVLNPGRARGEAGHAAQACVEVLHPLRSDLAFALLRRFHQVDTASRRIHLFTPEHVSGAGGQTEAAVYALADELGRGRMMPVE